MRFSPAQQRYNRRALWLSIAYMALLLPAVYLLSRHMVGGPAAYVIGVAPALPICGLFWAMGLYLVEESDEYLRMMQTRALLVATAIALTATTIWGFLEGFELVPHLPAYIWSVVWIGGLGIGAGTCRITARRSA
ncbi:hypothetical protein GCM10011380_03480 [Sphingomonas metalli]|uniref:Uncharacterized protein n=1 Tax=Sphingomonas metalli TaxID=1779358 RepID=A0A916SUK0_9SPHN|nr:hypothetical protein [Sphingomonas metalli]GGB17255.1 hypothetical protein GCM10011380_03480 [Sphingomonas metalli]